jgi:ubiquinone/menaquinone biosynthesis C-methylase UbiE
VVDLGSGGGLDVFLASKMVGPQGRAIGIDMTTAMIQRSRENAQQGGYTNVEFYQSTIDQIPLSDASRLCHFELRRESGSGQACCLPRDRACPEARWSGRPQ